MATPLRADETNEDASTGSELVRALCAAKAELKQMIGHTAKNDAPGAGGYTYVELAPILAHAEPILANHGLVVICTTDDEVEPIEIRTQSGSRQGVQVTVRGRLMHTSGEEIHVSAHGVGVNGDKAIYSAQTGARKYLMLQLLGLAGAKEDEPEHPKNEGQGTKPPQAPANRGTGHQPKVKPAEKAGQKPPKLSDEVEGFLKDGPVWLESAFPFKNKWPKWTWEEVARGCYLDPEAQEDKGIASFCKYALSLENRGGIHERIHAIQNWVVSGTWEG